MPYLLTRVRGARDLCSGDELKHNLLGKLARLEVHHIFPKKLLYEHGYGRAQVNAVANFCFLTQECNLEITARRPEEYFEVCEGKHPGVLASQWIPTDRSLWAVERYPDFLAARASVAGRGRQHVPRLPDRWHSAARGARRRTSARAHRGRPRRTR